MNIMKNLALALVIISSTVNMANANETTELSVSINSTIDALLKQNLDDIQQLNTIEASQFLLVSNTANKELQKFSAQLEQAKHVNNNTAKLTE